MTTFFGKKILFDARFENDSISLRITRKATLQKFFCSADNRKYLSYQTLRFPIRIHRLLYLFFYENNNASVFLWIGTSTSIVQTMRTCGRPVTRTAPSFLNKSRNNVDWRNKIKSNASQIKRGYAYAEHRQHAVSFFHSVCLCSCQ